MYGTRKNEIIFSTSMFIFGTIGLFVKNVSLSSGEIALYRALMAIVFLVVYFVISKRKFHFEAIKRELPFLFLSGAAMGVNWILLFEAYKYTTISVATLSYYFAPVLVVILSPLIFKEKTGLMQWLCFIMSTIGIVLITGTGDVKNDFSDIKGIAFGLGAAVFYATVMLLNKFIKNVEGIDRTLLQFISATIVLIPYVIISGENNLALLNGKGILCLLIVGFIHTGVTYCFYFSSIKELPGQKVAMLSYIDPLVAVVVSVTVLGEGITFSQIIGGVMILGFTLINEISFSKKHKNAVGE